jgi:hypothetical protein
MHCSNRTPYPLISPRGPAAQIVPALLGIRVESRLAVKWRGALRSAGFRGRKGVFQAESCPLPIQNYWLRYWSIHWPKGEPALYPSFELWRREAESYIPDGCDPKSASDAPSQS